METEGSRPHYHVFLSFKCTEDGRRTKDSRLAKKVYKYLSDRGILTFFCTERVGEPGFVDAINTAVEVSKVMVVVAVKAEHFDSRWVKHEWQAYIASHPNPKIFSYVKGVMPKELPPLLRPFTSIQHTGKSSLDFLYVNLKSILPEEDTDGGIEPDDGGSNGNSPGFHKLWKKLVTAGIVLIILILLSWLFLFKPKSISLRDLVLDIGRTKGISAQIDPAQARVNVQIQSLAEDGLLFLTAKGESTFSELLGVKIDRPIRVVIRGRIAGSIKCGLRAELETADQMGYELSTRVHSQGEFEASGQLRPGTRTCRFIFERCSGPIPGEVILSKLKIHR